MHTQGFHKNMKLKTDQAVGVSVPPGAKKVGDGGCLGFQREGRQSAWR